MTKTPPFEAAGLGSDGFNRERQSTPRPADIQAPARVVVTDASRRPIGTVILQADAFEALTLDDGSIGRFDTADAAAVALWCHARSSWTTLGAAAAQIIDRVSS